ncbi:MAG: class I SAM-dependent methyltransferase [Desulfobulbaceae bacterium]|nr:class I SAM-dependent methyltransferase [Desulfobulbaceae bacterium]
MQDNTNNAFDHQAATWEDNPQRVTLARCVAQAISRAIPITPKMEAMEYGCGTGLVSRNLAPFVKQITAIDSSGAMLAILEQKAEEEKLANLKTVKMDFAQPQTLSQQFDLLFCSMTLHHIPDLDHLLTRFWSLLQPGGFLALADLEPEDGTFHEDNLGVARYGLDPLKLSNRLTEMGAINGKRQTIHTLSKNGREYPVFLVTCQKSR